jgi:prepilin-type N-terminal cleavage/methylation domain-containing protein
MRESKKGFTLIEMIFVIAVTGVIAGMTFIQISQIYESLIQKNYSSEIQNEASVVSEQIVSRLSGAFKNSLAGADSTGGGGCKGLSDLTAGESKNVLMWVAKSDESEKGVWDANRSTYIGWSGVASNDGSKTFTTPASNMESVESIIDSLIEETGSLSQNSKSPVALYFHMGGEYITETGKVCDNFYNDGSDEFVLHQIKREGVGKITLLSNKNRSEINRYSITHAAYAIEKKENGDLWLYTFRPWLSEKPSSGKTKSLLARNVSQFGFKYDGGLFRINICLSKTVNGFKLEGCKERVVF